MARKHVTDLMVLEAVQRKKQTGEFLLQLLVDRTQEPMKVCWRALERTADKGLIDYGVSLRQSFITAKGLEYLKAAKEQV